MGYRSKVAYLIVFGTGATEEQEAKRFNHMDAPHREDALHNAKVAREAAKEMFYMFLTEAKVNENTMRCFDEEVDGAEKEEGLYIDQDRLLIKFYADYVKWYPDYDDVKCHEALLDMACDYFNEKDGDAIGGYRQDRVSAEFPDKGRLISTHFVRIGEEYNDIETVSNGGFYATDMLGVSRDVFFDK